MQLTCSHKAHKRRKILRKSNSQAFTLIFICLIGLITITLVTCHYKTAPEVSFSKQIGKLPLNKRDKACRLVHHVQDKCAYIKANCPDEEAGLVSYLSLYYCYLPNTHIVALGILSLWLALLFTTIGIAASDFFCINLNTIASKLGMSEGIAGTTFLAFGNGSPDVFSTFAAMNSKSGSLAVGELIGAAGFITTVVVGSMALAREFRVGRKILVRDVGFFIIAVCLTILFLADGTLHLWEFCVMVGYYLVYVVVVVVWHWHFEIRKKRRENETIDFGPGSAIGNEEIGIQEDETYDEDNPSRERYQRDVEDLNTLEQRSFPALTSYADDEDNINHDKSHEIRLAAEVASNMRVTRPTGSRRNTITPIRPSLVGALEFRSGFASFIERSRQANGPQIHVRGYSDDATPIGPSGERDFGEANLGSDASPVKSRVSISNDVAIIETVESDITHNSNTLNVEISKIGSYFSKNPELLDDRACLFSAPQYSSRKRSKSIRVNSSHSGYPRRRQKSETPTVLENDPLADQHLTASSSKNSDEPLETINDLCNDSLLGAQHLQVQTRTLQNSSHSRRSSISPFPAYIELQNERSIRGSKTPSLVSPSLNRMPELNIPDHGSALPEAPVNSLPYQYFPNFYTVCCTLFPTLCTWGQKSVWDKFVSVISAPSIFLLAITLPVVESDAPEEPQGITELELFLESNASSRMPSRRGRTNEFSLDIQPEWLAHRRTMDSQGNTSSLHLSYGPYLQNAYGVEEYFQKSNSASLHVSECNLDRDLLTHSNIDYESFEGWNRWLVSIQIFAAPIFLIFILWANSAERNYYTLNKMILYSLVGSLIAYFTLVLTTSPYRVPKYRFMLCFLGFFVSIGWISTIANEVVGVLKAIGVILDISDAILGLTIFAVGSSLGDLVADITIARLGFPVMALSACFGGPMLNILLGIGLSGIYVTVSEANSKHIENPGHGIKYRPYEIEVSNTLIISAVTLLITLVGILIAVPLHGWVMKRRIGWGLIIIWSISTVANIGLEVSSVVVSFNMAFKSFCEYIF
ncbi:putative sodium calcium exchanger protein [Golovinomyces cichoracearum]|uniref:Putative sodium calcium exchanger protein n=1 Tax=Golovinomyces cichoracearum TaxID=62708 RepID=A0A420IHJ3_9PEZI|nr:putative sodium calcium exchanger protein [Golovinomyces cichoracearum]